MIWNKTMLVHMVVTILVLIISNIVPEKFISFGFMAFIGYLIARVNIEQDKGDIDEKDKY